MKLVRTFSMIIALAGASTVFADTPQKAPPSDTKKAPDTKAPPAKDAPKGEEISQADAEKVLAFITKLVDAIVVNKDACPKMGAAINGVIDANKAFLAQANAMKSSGKTLPKDVQTKMNAKMAEAGPAIMKCMEDKDVKAAMARMDEKTGGKKADPPAAKKVEPAKKP